MSKILETKYLNLLEKSILLKEEIEELKQKIKELKKHIKEIKQISSENYYRTLRQRKIS